MNEISKPFLSVDLSDGHPLRFYSFDEVATWLATEQAAFRWFIEGGSQAGGGVANLRNLYANGFNNISQSLAQWRGEPDSQEKTQQFANVLTSVYSAPTFVRSDHAFARIASDIEAKDGPVAASAAFGLLLGVDCQINFNTTKGVMAAMLKQAGIDPKSPNLVAGTIADLNSSVAADRVRSAAEWASITDEAHALLRTTDDSFKSQTTAFEWNSGEALKRMSESGNASVKSIQMTEATYKEQMKLQAPVDYWETKGAKHRKALAWSRLNLILFTVLGSTILVGGLFFLTVTALNVAEKSTADTAIFLKFAAIGAVVTTIVFWIARVLLRIYLSDRHLLSDAEERVAMILTYLALSNDGKVETSDRALILAPLFRTASDGIVKEEGPDASVAGLMAKMLDLKPGR